MSACCAAVVLPELTAAMSARMTLCTLEPALLVELEPAGGGPYVADVLCRAPSACCAAVRLPACTALKICDKLLVN